MFFFSEGDQRDHKRDVLLISAKGLPGRRRFLPADHDSMSDSAIGRQSEAFGTRSAFMKTNQLLLQGYLQYSIPGADSSV